MSRPSGVALYFLVLATIGVIQNCATTLGEEIGWRGFLVPELAQRFPFTATAVLSGAIWALWHVPIIVFAGYNAGTEAISRLTGDPCRSHDPARTLHPAPGFRPGCGTDPGHCNW